MHIFDGRTLRVLSACVLSLIIPIQTGCAVGARDTGAQDKGSTEMQSAVSTQEQTLVATEDQTGMSAETQTSGFSFTDDTGRLVTLEKEPVRVVAAEGSFAEIWTLAGGTIIGIPEDVIADGRMAVTKDTTVIGTIKEPNAEIILGLKPDFVILASDIDSHSGLAQILEANRIPYAFFKTEYFSDYLEVLKIFTDITGHPELYEKYGTVVETDIRGTLDRVKGEKSSKILLIRAFAKGARAKGTDNTTGAMLEELGAVNIVDKYPSLLEDISLEQVVLEDPDFILITTMGSEEQAMSYMKTGIMANPAWSTLSAVKNNRVIVLPKDLFHYKPNARWDEAYEYLAQILYPES